MTEPHADALDGRVLDAEVARHLFELDVEQRQNARTGETDFVCREPGASWNRVPY